MRISYALRKNHLVLLGSIQVVLCYHTFFFFSHPLALFRFDSAVGQRCRINGWSFGAAITVGYHAKWGVLALPERWDTVITLDYATGSSPFYLHCWITVGYGHALF